MGTGDEFRDYGYVDCTNLLIIGLLRPTVLPNWWQKVIRISANL